MRETEGELKPDITLDMPDFGSSAATQNLAYLNTRFKSSTKNLW